MRNVHGFSGGSKLGTSSDSLLHSCAYIDEYLGSSKAFSKISIITPLIIRSELSPIFNKSSLSF